MRTTQDKLNLMMDCFVHDGAFYLQQTADGYHQVKANGKPAVFTAKQLIAHLNTKQPGITYGPYQINAEDTVKWVCLDIDGYEASADDIQQMTHSVAKSVQKFRGKRTALVEDSGSKGYHVWVLFEEPIATAKGYAFGHMIVEDVSPMEGINLEVYPKQKTRGTGFGNTVKLPLGIHQKTGKRCVFVNAQFEPYEDQWQRLKDVKRVSVDTIDPVLSEEEQQATGRSRASSLPPSPYAPICLTRIMEEGCPEGMRDEAMFRLACYAREKGFPDCVGHAVLCDTNTRNTPPLDEATIDAKITSAYGDNDKWFPCRDPRFDSYCHSACNFFTNKALEQRGYKTVEEARGVISSG